MDGVPGKECRVAAGLCSRPSTGCVQIWGGGCCNVVQVAQVQEGRGKSKKCVSTRRPRKEITSGYVHVYECKKAREQPSSKSTKDSIVRPNYIYSLLVVKIFMFSC